MLSAMDYHTGAFCNLFDGHRATLQPYASRYETRGKVRSNAWAEGPDR
jgi:hypothetical protein